MAYAENTCVPVERSRAEIERLLTKYGADEFMSGSKPTMAMLQFRLNDRMVRFTLPYPPKDSAEFSKTPTGRAKRNPDSIAQAWDQEVRRRWRSLALMVKAKLEAVSTGIVTFDEEFLSHFVMPNQMTFAEWVIPQLEKAYSSGKMPGLLALPGSTG